MSGQRWSNAILESDWLALWLAIIRRANKTADKMPALAQQMIAIWVVAIVIRDCNAAFLLDF